MIPPRNTEKSDILGVNPLRFATYAANSSKNIKIGTFISEVAGIIIDCQYQHPLNGSYSVCRYVVTNYSNGFHVHRISLGGEGVSADLQFIGISGSDLYFVTGIDPNCICMPHIIDYYGFTRTRRL